MADPLECPICGVEAGEHQEYDGGGISTWTEHLAYKGCCSKECARVLVQVRARWAERPYLISWVMDTKNKPAPY